MRVMLDWVVYVGLAAALLVAAVVLGAQFSELGDVLAEGIERIIVWAIARGWA